MTRTQSQKKRARAAAVKKARDSGPGTATSNVTRQLQAQINKMQNKMSQQSKTSSKKSAKSQAQKSARRAPSGYLRYLLYPELRGGKIPDGASLVPTCTKQFVFRGVFYNSVMNSSNTTYNAAGVRVDIVGSNSSGAAQAGTPIRIYTVGGSTNNTINWVEQTSNYMGGSSTPMALWAISALPSVYRIVSCCVNTTFQGNTVNNGGSCMSYNDFDATSPATFTDLDNSTTITRGRITDKPCKAIYRPLSSTDTEMQSCYFTSGNLNLVVSNRPQSFGTLYRDNDTAFRAEFVVYLNLEYIPQSNVSADLNPGTPAVDNPGQMREAASFLGKASGYIAIPALLNSATNYVYGSRPLPAPNKEFDGFFGLDP